MWLGWLLVVPLLAALGWLVWTISEDVRSGGDASTQTASETAAVGSGEAREVAEEFYDRLLGEGLAAARELTTDEAFIDEGIAVNLTSLDVSGLESVENQDGTATVTAMVTYAYGERVIVQDETLRVDRVDGAPLIVSRYAAPVSDSADE